MGDQFGKDNIPWEGPHTGAGAVSNHVLGTDCSPHSLLPCITCRKEVERLKVKMSLLRREGLGKVFLVLFLVSYYPNLLLICNKLI